VEDFLMDRKSPYNKHRPGLKYFKNIILIKITNNRVPWKFAFFLGFCLAFVIAPAGSGLCQSNDRTLDRTILAKGSDTYIPYSFIDEEGKVDGFNNELFRAVAETAGLKAKIALESWPRIRQELESGKIDVITGMYYSKERDKLVDFSIPHNIIKYSIFVRKDSAIKSLVDLNEKEIIVMRGAISHDFLKTKGVAGKIITTNDTPAALKYLASGKHDCAILVRLQGLYLMKKLKIENVKIVGEPFKPMKFCFAVSEGDSTLLARLNEALSIVKETGKYGELYNKYFGILEQKAVSFRRILKYIAFILIPILGLLAASILWSWSLRRQVGIRSKELTVELSERKKAEEAVRKSEVKSRTILENIEEGYYETDMAGNFTFFNASLCRMLGYATDELMGMNNREFMTKETAKKVYKTFNKVYTTGKPNKGSEFELIGKDGTKKDMEVSISLMRDEEGQRIGFQGIWRDVTEKKRVEAELIQTKNFLQNIFDSSIDGITSTDLEGNIIYSSSRAKDILGYEREKLFGKKVYLHYEKGEEDAKKIMKELKLKGELRNHEMMLKKKDGGLIDINLSASYLKNEKGEVIGTLGIYRDISERKHLESQLRQAQKMESIGTLAGGIAHDFNNILSPIMIHSEIGMMELPPDNPIQHNLKEILKAGERARDMVKQILAFSRKEEGRRAEIKIIPILKEVLKLLRSSIPTTIDIHHNLEAESDTVLADPTQIHQIVLNLGTNAAHAMRERGGSLEVGLVQEDLDSEAVAQYSDLNPGSYLKLTVSDTGCGIDGETMQKIFDPYFTTKGPGEGTGMGLAVIHGIVKSYGAHITVESELGKGTTFKVYLPGIAADVSPVAEPSVQLPRGTERILLVDDEKVAVDAIQPILENLGYQVNARTSSIEALEAFRNNPATYDLVITDMTMPNMTGKDLAKELMTIRPDIPIILCTGFSEKIDEDKAKEMGISFVMKPIVIRDITNTIRQVLEKNDE